MRSPSIADEAPGWMHDWPRAWPRPAGSWTVAGGAGWGTLDPESGRARVVDPAADRRLPDLAELVHTGRLLSYRAGRRAVIRRDGLPDDDAGPGEYVKVVRPSRLDDVVRRHRRVADTGIVAPAVRDVVGRGAFVLSAVPGETLHTIVRSGDAPPLDEVVGVLVELHELSAAPEADVHRPDDPARWIGVVGRIEPRAVARLRDVAARLPTVESLVGPQTAVVHGDLHDKNLLIDRGCGGRTSVGVIDVDQIARGDAEADVANLAVHLELRGLQAGEPDVAARAAGLARQLVERYDAQRPLDAARLEGLARHTWFRLACLYRCRLAGRRLFEPLLHRAVAPIGGVVAPSASDVDRAVPSVRR